MGRVTHCTIRLVMCNIVYLRHSYVELDEEFLVSDSDWKWLLNHTEYSEPELHQLLQGSDPPNTPTVVELCEGFRDEYPGGGIYRHQFEQWTGNTVMNIIFKLISHIFHKSI